MMNIEELEGKKRELEEQIRKMNEEIELAKQEEYIQNTPVTIRDIHLEDGLVYFKSNFRDDFVAFLRTIEGRKWNGTHNTVPAENWKSFEEKAKLIRNVHIEGNFDISTYKPKPRFKVEHNGSDLKVWLGRQGIAHRVHSIPGSEVHYLKEGTYYSVPLAEAWRLFESLQNEELVEWDEASLLFAEKQISMRESLDSVAKLKKYEMQIDLNGQTLKDFQTVGVRFAELGGFNCIIADEMGLGKTPEAIASLQLLSEMYGNDAKFLIICPASIRANWTRELIKFLNATPYEMYGESPTKVDIINILKGDYKYYLTNYDVISTMYEETKEYQDDKGFIHNKTETRMPWIEILNLGNFKGVIVDEAHKIKNTDAKRSRAVRELQIPHKILLTGTPMLNRPGELWPLINFIDPNLVGSFEGFIRRYTYDKKTARNVDELRQILKPIMIRRVKKDVMSELDPINRINQVVELSKQGQNAYDKALNGLWLEFDSWDGSHNNTQQITNILAQILKLKQICAWDKIEATADLATELHDSMVDSEEECNKVIIFTQFVNSPECVNEICKRLGVDGVIQITGAIPPSDRMRYVDRFQNDKSINYLVCSTQAAGEGLNLTKAGAVVFNDMMWTPGSHHQAEGRAYGRISEPHSISSYYLVCKDTIEDDIVALLLAKLHMFNEIVEGTEASRDSGIAMELLQKLRARRFQK